MQTPKLIDEYKKLYPLNEKETDLLEQINMMTVENIHINSFMYEPIIDMSDNHLKDIYIYAKSMLELTSVDKLIAATKGERI